MDLGPASEYGIYFSDYGVKVWEQITERCRIRDRELLRTIAPYFNSGTVLDLGGGCGQFVQYFSDLGFDVTGSDHSEFFIDYQKRRGYRVLKIDATDISAYTPDLFDNIFAQALPPLILRSENDARNRKTYASMHAVLRPKGRVVIPLRSRWMELWAFCTFRSARRTFLSFPEHLAIVDSMKLFRVVKVINHMVVPPGFYSYDTRKLLNWVDFNIGGLMPFRHLIVLEKI